MVLSFYHHLSHQKEGQYLDSFDTFLEDWCNGKIPYGRWIDHLSSWHKAISSPENEGRLLLVRYEDLVNNLDIEVQRIANFLDLKLAAARVREISSKLTFDVMKAEINKYQPVSVTWTDGFQFLRNGKIGDSFSYFTPYNHEQYDKMIKIALPEGTIPWGLF